MMQRSGEGKSVVFSEIFMNLIGVHADSIAGRKNSLFEMENPFYSFSPAG